jgi:hypothetical protein
MVLENILVGLNTLPIISQKINSKCSWLILEVLATQAVQEDALKSENSKMI